MEQPTLQGPLTVLAVPACRQKLFKNFRPHRLESTRASSHMGQAALTGSRLTCKYAMRSVQVSTLYRSARPRACSCSGNEYPSFVCHFTAQNLILELEFGYLTQLSLSPRSQGPFDQQQLQPAQQSMFIALCFKKLSESSMKFRENSRNCIPTKQVRHSEQL